MMKEIDGILSSIKIWVQISTNYQLLSPLKLRCLIGQRELITVALGGCYEGKRQSEGLLPFDTEAVLIISNTWMWESEKV